MQKIIIIISVAFILFFFSGCITEQSLNLVSADLTGYGVVEMPEGVFVTHRNWIGPDARIQLEFNKKLESDKDLEILIFSGGAIRTVYPEKSQVDRKYDYYKINGKVLSILPVDQKRGLQPYFVAVILPKELRAADGSYLEKDTFLYLSSMWPSPQSIVERKQDSESPLTIPVYGTDNREIAYLLEESPIFSHPNGDLITDLKMGENVQIINALNDWSEVAVFYPKYYYNEKEMDLLSGIINVWESNLVKKLTGYVPTHLLHKIPKPQNAQAYVAVNYTYEGHDQDRLLLEISFNALPVSNSSGYLLPGEKVSAEQINLLEAAALWRVEYYSSGRSYASSYGKPPGIMASFHDPWVHHPYFSWTDRQYNRYLDMRVAYIERLERFWDEYLVVPQYYNLKDELLDNFRKRVKMQDIWVKWAVNDKELLTETIASMIAEEFSNSQEEKMYLYSLINDSGPLDNSEGFLQFLNEYLFPRQLIESLSESYSKLFVE